MYQTIDACERIISGTKSLSRGRGGIPCTVQVLGLHTVSVQNSHPLSKKAEHGCRFRKFDGIRMRKLFPDCFLFQQEN